MNIVVSNVKGGVGKTTSAIYLAAVAASGSKWRPVALVDADRQASSAEWLEQDPIDGVELIEAPSERTVVRALDKFDGTVVVDTPPGDERIVRAAILRADAVVIPTRAGGVEPTRVLATLQMIPKDIPCGVVVCAARLGTNDLAVTVEEWAEAQVPVWGVVPERVGIAAGPGARLHREGLEEYARVFKRAQKR
ncbi:MAG: ParA family protein [Acidimicrobiales bacterium]|jgi:chromosome partitioning protein